MSISKYFPVFAYPARNGWAASAQQGSKAGFACYLETIPYVKSLQTMLKLIDIVGKNVDVSEKDRGRLFDSLKDRNYFAVTLVSASFLCLKPAKRE